MRTINLSLVSSQARTRVVAKKPSKDVLMPYVYLVPALILFLVFMVYPVARSIVSSTWDWDGLSAGRFVGWKNYWVLLHDGNFWNSLKITAIWVTLSGGLLPLTGAVLALLVDFGTKSRVIGKLARTVLFIPMTISFVAVGLLFTLFFNPMQGVISGIAHQFGVLSDLDLLGEPRTTVPTIFVVVLWQWSGFGMVIFAAALAGMPTELYDSASIDGATKLQVIRHIVVPLLIPTYLVVVTINVIGGFKAFDLIYVMTAGGPGEASETTSIFLYKQAFILHRFGYGSAVAIVLFFLVVIATLILSRLRRA
jgi:raffinose/stachyose/melibiose transport system permease protein